MKKIYALAVLALVMLGCQKSELEVDNNPELTEREITAIGSISTSSDSKAYVDDNWGVYWSTNQQLGAWATDGANSISFSTFSSINDGGEDYIEFSGTIAGNSLRFVHPYKSSTITNGKFSISVASQSVDMESPKSHLTDNMYMMSDEVYVVNDVIDGFDGFEIHHVGSILNLNINFDGILGSEQAYVTKVELLGVSTEATLDLSSSSTLEDCLSEVSNESSLVATVSNSAAVSDNGTVVVPVAVLPGEFSDLQVVVTYIIGSEWYLLSKDISFESNISIEQGNYYDVILSCDSDCNIVKYTLEGNGTSTSPYLISSKDDLETFQDLVNYGIFSIESSQASSQSSVQQLEQMMVEVESFDPATGVFSNELLQVSQFSQVSAIQRTAVSTENQVYFELTKSIDLEGDADNQWTAIGTSSNPFTGHFNGGGYTISGIYIDNELNHQGFFGCVGEDGIVKNLSVDGSISASSSTGGVVSWNEGTISNCWNIGDVNSTGNYIGGVVGINYYGTIINCYNTGSVSGSSWIGGVAGVNSSGTIINCYNIGDLSASSSRSHIGGVVGYNYDSNSTIINCYNSGSVSGGSDSGLGGVAGANRGTIDNCYNTGGISSIAGGVSGISIVGGVAGINYYGTITNSYNTGSVSGSTWVGGVVGENSGAITNCYSTGSVSGYSIYIGGVGGTNYGTISNCYWNGDVYYFGNSVSTNTGTLMDLASKTTSEMKKTDFVELLNAEQSPAPWEADSDQSINSGYPILSWQVE